MANDADNRPRDDRGNLLYGETDNRIISGHNYDGIKEYDNPMPGWWVWIFIATIAFSVFYWVGISYFGWINTYEDDLAESLEDLRMIREAHAAEHPAFEIDEENLIAFLEDDAALEGGQRTYMMYCAACHGAQGQGSIGPNLTDGYFIHGGTLVDVYTVITDGIADRGMPGWENTLTAEERAALTAYLRSIEGSNPPNPRPPEGEPREDI
jgi:cytochrome c oxidase cbb3-type subunit III